MRLLKSTPESIYFPLMVMLLLTFLVGITAYQLIDAWQDATGRMMRNAVQAVMLTNIRWGLHQVRAEFREKPEQAMAHWVALQNQGNLLMHAEPDNLEFRHLRGFLGNRDNVSRIGSLPEKALFSVSLSGMQAELDRLRQYSQIVTLLITAFMIILGGVLTAITAWDLSRLVRALLRSRDLNVCLQEEERRRIAHDLHDGVVQELIDLKRHYAPEKVDALVNNLRRVCHNLKPQVLDDLGLAAGLEFLADDLRGAGLASVRVNLEAEALAQLPRHYELPIFRVVQEMFSNIKRHAGASQVTLSLVYDPSESSMLSAYVSDNGCGFDPARADSASMGLAGIRERIQQLGGKLTIESAPGQGSRLQFLVPVRSHVSGHV